MLTVASTDTPVYSSATPSSGRGWAAGYVALVPLNLAT